MYFIKDKCCDRVSELSIVKLHEVFQVRQRRERFAGFKEFKATESFTFTAQLVSKTERKTPNKVQVTPTTLWESGPVQVKSR